MKHTAIRTILSGIAAAALLLAAAGCGRQAEADAPAGDGSLQKVLDAGQLVVGLDTGYPPIGFVDGSGEIVGFDVDVAREACSRLGVKLVLRHIDWDDKEEELNSGNIDCIWNGMSITPARAETMCLSEPYMKNELIFVVTAGSSAQSLLDLKGARVGVQAGSTTHDALEASAIYGDITAVTFDGIPALMEQLRRGGIDAALIDSIVAYYYLFSSGEQYFVLDDSLAEEDCAIGFRKGDRALRDRVQETISEMKADGTLGEISQKWFGCDITTVR